MKKLSGWMLMLTLLVGVGIAPDNTSGAQAEVIAHREAVMNLVAQASSKGLSKVTIISQSFDGKVMTLKAEVN